MQISQLLRPQDVLVGLKAGSKAALLRALAEKLAARAGVDTESIEKTLLAREELGSTGIGRGIALPHARLPGLSASYAVLARLSAPVDFAAIDGAPVDLICALVSPDQPRQESLAALAAVSKVLREPPIVETLRSAKDAAAMHSVL